MLTNTNLVILLYKKMMKNINILKNNIFSNTRFAPIENF